MNKKLTKKLTVVIIAIVVIIIIWQAPLFLQPMTNDRYNLEELRVFAMGIAFGLLFGYVIWHRDK